MASWREPPAPVAEEEIHQTLKTDVVVVGLGYAGTAAVRQAAEQGAQVIGVEQMAREKYNSFGRDIGHINSKFLESRGIPKVDPIDLYNEMMMRSGNRANPSLVMKFTQNCGAAFDWFTDMYGVEGLDAVHTAFWPQGGSKFKESGTPYLNGRRFWYGTAQFPDPHGWPGGPTLPDVVISNFAAAEQAGAKLLFATTAVQPVMEGRRVAGIIARQADGSYLRILAKKGVILAAGDFSGNQEMMKELVTDVADLQREGKSYPKHGGRKGVGIQMGVWAGGKLEPRPLAIMGGNYTLVPGFTTFGVLWLNRDGKRFCNETFGGPELAGFAGNQMPMGTYYNIFDSHVLEDLQWAVPAHGGFDQINPNSENALREIMRNADEHPTGHPDSMEPMRKSFPFGYVAKNIYSGATPEELVQNAGLTGELADQVVRSIQRYQQVCQQGRDDDFGKDPRLLRPFEGRLYLQASDMTDDWGFMLVTVGGLVTDENQNVLDGNYEPIPGLYASGNCCGRRFGQVYTTPIAGVSISMALTLGRLAGDTVAKL
jgi:hypothetical protein